MNSPTQELDCLFSASLPCIIQPFWPHRSPLPFTFLTSCSLSLLAHPSPLLLTQSSSGSCAHCTLPDVSAFGCALPHVYNKPLPPPYLEAVRSYLFVSFLLFKKPLFYAFLNSSLMCKKTGKIFFTGPIFKIENLF